MAGKARSLDALIQSHRAWRPLGLSEVPTEILTKIFYFVLSEQTLRSIALTCRRFHQVVESQLYREIFVKCGTRCQTESANGSPREDQLRRIVLHLLRNQSITPHIKHVRLLGPQNEDYAFPPENADDIDIELEKAVQKYLKRPNNDSEKLTPVRVSWLSFTFADQTTLLVLFLSLLPQITSLHIQMPDEQLLADGLLSLSVFDGLQKITLEWIRPPSRMLLTPLKARHLKQLIAIVSLREVCLVNFGSQPGIETNDSAFARVKRRSSACTHLEMRRSTVIRKDYLPMLEIFGALKTFVYEMSWSAMLGNKHINASLLIPGLWSSHKDSIENLWLDLSHDVGTNRLGFRRHALPEDTLRLLTDFRCLRRLCLPMDFLFTYDPAGMNAECLHCFPPSLETLVLINRYNILDRHVATFVEEFSRALAVVRADENAADTVPRLRTVVLVAQVDHFLWCSSFMLAELERFLNLEVLFAHDECHKTKERLFSETCTKRIRELERSMCLSSLQSCRWRGIDNSALQRACKSYENLRDTFGRRSSSRNNDADAEPDPPALRKLAKGIGLDPQRGLLR